MTPRSRRSSPACRGGRRWPGRPIKPPRARLSGPRPRFFSLGEPGAVRLCQRAYPTRASRPGRPPDAAATRRVRPPEASPPRIEPGEAFDPPCLPRPRGVPTPSPKPRSVPLDPAAPGGRSRATRRAFGAARAPKARTGPREAPRPAVPEIAPSCVGRGHKTSLHRRTSQGRVTAGKSPHSVGLEREACIAERRLGPGVTHA